MACFKDNSDNNRVKILRYSHKSIDYIEHSVALKISPL